MKCFALHAEKLDDVLWCRDEAQDVTARSPCWILVLTSRFAKAAAAAAAEVGACAVVGADVDLRSAVAGGLGAPTAGAVFRVAGGQLHMRGKVVVSGNTGVQANGIAF